MIKCSRAKQLLEDVDRSVKEIKSFMSASLPEKAYLAKFLAVYICGVYEEAIECIMNERIDALGSVEMDKFFTAYVKSRFRNPDIGNVNGLLGQFNDAWKAKINALPMSTKTAFDNILSNKNKVAHGQPCGATLREVLTDYKRSKRVIAAIDRIVKFA